MSRCIFPKKQLISVGKVGQASGFSVDELKTILPADYITNNNINMDKIIEINELLNIRMMSGNNFDEDMAIMQKILPKDKKIPVVSLMGHVDHGKTALLQKLKPMKQIEEVGGITQNIRILEWIENEYKMFLLDTPGHEILSTQRKLVAKISDLIIIVIDCDKGIEQETINIIKHTEGKNIIICFTKIDKGGKKINQIKSELTKYKIFVEDLGGSVKTAEVSVNKGYEDSINSLKELIVNRCKDLNIMTEIDREAMGYVLDSWNSKMGLQSVLYLSCGEIKIGDNILTNNHIYKIKNISINNEMQNSSNCTNIVMASGIEETGHPFIVIDDDVLSYIKSNISSGKTPRIFDENKINFICKAVSALQLTSLCEVVAKHGNIISSTITSITKNEIDLAKSFNCCFVIFGNMNTKILEDNKIKFIQSEIIYKIQSQLEENNKKEKIVEKILGKATVKDTFDMKAGYVVGCAINEGLICLQDHGQKCNIKIMRNDVVMYNGNIRSIQINKKDVSEASKGNDCGLLLKNCKNIMKGDLVICYREEIFFV